MTWTDTFRMAAHNIRQRRGRAALSLLGIVLGCVILLMADAGTRGVSRAIEMLFSSSAFVRQIRVVVDQQAGIEVPEEALTVDADLSRDRRERIQDMLRGEWLSQHASQINRRMTFETLRQLEELPHVVDVTAGGALAAQAFINDRQHATSLSTRSRESELTGKLVEGTIFSEESDEELLIDDLLAWKLGFIDDSDLKRLVGQTIHVTLNDIRQSGNTPFGGLAAFAGFQLLPGPDGPGEQGEFVDAFQTLIGDLDATSLTVGQKQLMRSLSSLLPDRNTTTHATKPEEARVREFQISGVYRTDSSSDFTDLFRTGGAASGLLISPKAERRLRQELQPGAMFSSATITLSDHTHLADTIDRLETDGYRCISALRILDRINEAISRIRRIMFALAGIILVITCLGICNTQFVSILERTPEIGVMKSLGADDSHVLRLMLCEGAVLGIIGGVVSIPIGILLGRFGDGLLREYAEHRVRGSLNDGLFDFEWTSAGAVVVVAGLLCVLAGLIPAIRAARLDPVDAMRRG